MQPINPLDEILSSPVSLKLLRHLVTYGGISFVQAHRVLNGFTKQGIVLKRRAGTACLFKINENHVLVNCILKPLFESERTLIVDTIKENIAPLKEYISSAVVYGSVTEGTSRYDSDVDLLLLLKDSKKVEEAKDKASAASVEFTGVTGNRLDMLILTPSEYRAAKKGGKGVIEAIEKGQLIIGKPINEALENK